MSRFHRPLKVLALATCGGVFWILGAGSCLPYNFYSTLLGNSIIATFASTISTTIANTVFPGAGT